MQYLFALLVLVAVVVCAMAQFPYYGGYYGSYAAPAVAYNPYAYNYGAYGYGAYSPALSYFYKK